MKKYVLTENERAASGGYTRLVVLDYDGGDFTSETTSQTYALHSIGMGDVIQYPLCKVYVKTALGGVTTPVIRVGYNATVADPDFLLGATTGLSISTTGAILYANRLNATAGGPVSFATASGMVGITATITSAVNAIQNATEGTIHIYLAYVPLVQFERPTGVGYEAAS